MDHPVIKEVETWGYPKSNTLHDYVMTDSFNNEIYTGDEYLVYEDEIFLADALTLNAIEVLELIGAERKRA